jgi:subtilisin family serine protease
MRLGLAICLVCTGLLCAALSGPVTGQPAEARIVAPPAVRDVNANRIDDALEVKLATGTLTGPGPGAPVQLAPGVLAAPAETGRKPYADLLVSLDHPPGPADFRQIAARGGQVIRAWDRLVFCMNVRLPGPAAQAGAVRAVAALPHVAWVEENHPVELLLHYSTRQTRARSAWTRSTAVDGDSSVRLAVCDSGLDGTFFGGSGHTDLSGKIAAWYDAYYEIHKNDPSPRTQYTAAGDRNGHGSHVGGIIAGTGAAAGISTGKGLLGRTHSAFFPTSAGGVWDVTAARMPIDTTGIGANSAISSSSHWYFSASNRILASLWTSAFPSGELNWDWKGSGATQPLDVSYPYLASDTQDFAYVGSPYPYSDNAGDCWYVSQNACRQVAIGDGYNLNAGVAPACDLVGLRVVSEFGGGDSDASELIEALSWIDANRVTYNIVGVNISLKYGSGPGGALDTAVNSLVGNGVVCVVAAGNARGTEYVGEPGTAARAVTVAATNELDRITSYSSVGDTGSGKPDVAAPGGSTETQRDITSVDTNDSEYIENWEGGSDAVDATERFANDYSGKTGTSMSAPHVTGLVGLIADALRIKAGGGSYWDWSLNQALAVKSLICMTATETNQNAEATPNPTLDRGAKDACEGYGRINADAAVSAVLDLFAIDGSGSGTASTAFSSDPTGRKCWARYVELARRSEYVFSMTVPSGCDADLYLYDDVPGTDGDPVIVLSSTTATTAGNSEGFTRTVVDPGDATEDTYYLVAKLVSGTGEFTISSIGITPVQVGALRASTEGGQPCLRWRVEEPGSLVGFSVFGAADPGDAWDQCNERLIVAEGGNVMWRIPPRLLRAGVRYFRLQSVDLHGARTDHGYVEVQASPTRR